MNYVKRLFFGGFVSTMLVSGVFTQFPEKPIKTLPAKPQEEVVAEEASRSVLPVVADAQPRVLKTYYSQVTVYHSVPWETDSDPWTTAAGTRARDGVLAANCLPFGTTVRLPELFGEKIFIVEDRLAADKSCYILDIWKEYNPNDKSFGAPVAKVEIVKIYSSRQIADLQL